MENLKNVYLDLMFKYNLEKNPIYYEWSDDIVGRFLHTTEGNIKLKNILNKMGYKASIGFAACLLKLVIIRLDGHPELSKEFVDDMNNRVSSVFAAAIDPMYSHIIKYGRSTQVPSDGPIHGPCWAVLTKIMLLSNEYNKKSYFIHTHLVGPSLLLEHMAPDKKIFQKWFAETVKRAADVFPCQYEYNDRFTNKDIYDCSGELPVPQEFFFDENFQYTLETAKQKINAFLQSLNYKSNPYLRSPEEMLEAGFKGTPYAV
jgi:hypothetical protein